ncbi:MAG: family 78 glycoside hydrolase catalytic domain [Clostridia bacterium]|nr:family 78 glycoside hydrolase catalytic domain [Clostridia bacterium]
MKFNSKWITTKEFNELSPINIYHKEYDKREMPKTPDELMNNHCYIRKSFEGKKGKSYKMNISADDYYKLYINGEFVCQGPASGYVEEYYYNTVDITPYIKDGKNLIAVHVYYQGFINRVWTSGDNRQGLIADVYEDDKFLFGTDESWLYSYAKEYVSGGRIGYSTQYLEFIDFNLATPFWNKEEFDDSDYLPSVIKENDDHNFIGSVPTLQTYTLKPALIKELKPGHFFVDMGKEYTGQIHFKVKGKKGERVIVRCGEELLEENKVRHIMRCNCRYEEALTLSGDVDEALFYDYKAFRYAEISSEGEAAEITDIDMFVRHYPFSDDAFSFKCSDSLTEDIWAICAQALKIGVQEAYLDCPSREKGQYLGDFVVTGLAHMYLTGDSNLYKKALMEFAYSTKICKGMMAIAPASTMQEIADYSLLYPHAVYNYYKYTGDDKTMRELIPVMEGIIEHFRQFVGENGLLCGVKDKWNLVDWPENLRDDYDFLVTNPPQETGCHNVVNAYYYFAHKTLEDIKKELNIPCEIKSEEIKKDFIKEFYKEDKKLFTDTKESEHSALHSNVLPLYFGIAPDEAKENIKNLIVGKGLCCGVWFSYFVLKALAKIGAYDEEFSLITNKTEHSWYNMIKEGATTCFEAWGVDQKDNTSLCHPWASSAIIALIEDIMGIKGESFYGDSTKSESHMPKGVKIELKLPGLKGSLEFEG